MPLVGQILDEVLGFRRKANEWIYPKNVPMRCYQAEIAETAIFQNTLVCLPTGLGKTLIAAVVMYNYYRWFPLGKIVFLAPTKPLVDQQRDACLYKVSIAEVGNYQSLLCDYVRIDRVCCW